MACFWVCHDSGDGLSGSTVSYVDAENSTRDAWGPPSPLLRHRHIRALFLEGGDHRQRRPMITGDEARPWLWGVLSE